MTSRPKKVTDFVMYFSVIPWGHGKGVKNNKIEVTSFMENPINKTFRYNI